MGKRKSAKPQKYVQQSDEDDDDHLNNAYDAENEPDNNNDEKGSSSSPIPMENNVKAHSANNNHDQSHSATNHDFNDSNDLLEKHKLNLFNNLYQTHHERLFQLGSDDSLQVFRTKPNVLDHKQLQSVPDKNSTILPFMDDPLSDNGKNTSVFNLSGTESDRRSLYDFDDDCRGTRTKRRRKYVTYPATFRLEVVEHAEKHGKSSSAKKYNICVEKVSMWCKTKDNIVHKVKKGGFSFSDCATNDSYDEKMDDTPNIPRSDSQFDLSSVKTDDTEMDLKKRLEVSKQLNMLLDEEEEEEEESDRESEKCDENEIIRTQEIIYPPHFKLRVIRYAEEKGETAAVKEYGICEDRVHLWCQVKDVIEDLLRKQPAEEWECDLYILLKSSLERSKRVTVRDLLLHADILQRSKSASSMSNLSTEWLTRWCQKFKVLFNSPSDSVPPPLTDDAFVMLESSSYLADREETQAFITKGKKTNKVQELIEESKRNTDASPSTSDKEDTLSFNSNNNNTTTNNKRRRRSYTLAFKLEVVKFAQSHTKHATSRKYGIAGRVISRWVADKEILENDLLHATQHVLGDSKLTEHVDNQLLKWYKELKKKGMRVSKSMLCARADSLFGTLGLNNVSASNGWYRHWVLKWRELGEELHIVDDDSRKHPPSLSNSSSNTLLPSTNLVPSLLNSSNSQQGSSLDALKQASLAGAILSSMQSSNPDWKVMSQFPELMNAIHSSNPSNMSMTLASQMAAAAAAANANIFQSCGPSLQSIASYFKDQNQSFNSGSLHNQLLLDAGNNLEKNKAAQAKKRRERYSPEFKLTVIDYAKSHSYQETSRKFGVHHITVSEWCKDKERIRRKVYCENLHTKILKSETAEQKFLAWLQECNRQKIVIKPTDVQSKASEILSLIGEAEVKKNSWWFYLWNKRGLDTEKFFEDEQDIDFMERESRVNYPPAVKIEIAKIAERQSVNSAARCFRVARKRIREWVKTKDKLSWLAETGQVRERTSSLSGKKVNCLDADKEVYDWYKTISTPESVPKFSDIRIKALEIFQKFGFCNMKCTREWYKNWCKRYDIHTNCEKDDTLIRWVLSRYDENLPVTEHELLKFVSSISKKDDSGNHNLSGYGKAFCKRYPKLFESLPSMSETFPEDMEADIEKFRDTVQELQEENHFSLSAVGCMDEVAISFVTSGKEKRVTLNCGMDSCDAVVVMSCLADGTLLPPLIVLKKQELSRNVNDTSFVIYKDLPLVDDSTIKTWMEKVWLSSVASPSLLVMDCFKPHAVSAFQEVLQQSGITPLVIPHGCASKLQPLHVSVTKSFQYCIQDTWNRNRIDGANNVQSTTPSQVEIVRWVTDAYVKLQYQREIVRRSFVMTGITLVPDGSEEGLLESSDMFRNADEDHILSPVSTDGEDSES